MPRRVTPVVAHPNTPAAGTARHHHSDDDNPPSAGAKSPIKSSGCSRPMDHRCQSAGVAVSGPSMDARCSIRLCVPPKFVARTNTCTRAAAARRPLAPTAYPRNPSSAAPPSGAPDAPADPDNAPPPAGDAPADTPPSARPSECAAIRKGRVLMPRSVSQQSNGAGTAPCNSCIRPDAPEKLIALVPADDCPARNTFMLARILRRKPESRLWGATFHRPNHPGLAEDPERAVDEAAVVPGGVPHFVRAAGEVRCDGFPQARSDMSCRRWAAVGVAAVMGYEYPQRAALLAVPYCHRNPQFDNRP